MDVRTAHHVVVTQTDTTQNDAFLARLYQQLPPIPGQVTSLLLALRVLHKHLNTASSIERDLAYGLHQLAYASRQYYEQGKAAHVDWPPLLDADLERIAAAVAQILKGHPS